MEEARISSTDIAELLFSTTVKHSSTSEAGQGIQYPVRNSNKQELLFISKTFSFFIS